MPVDQTTALDFWAGTIGEATVLCNSRLVWIPMIAKISTTGAMVFRAVRSAQPRNDLLGPGGVVAILGFVAVTVGVSLAVAFILKASGVSYAATIGVSVAAVLLVVGGPMLMRYLQGRMLANRSGSRR
jgi:hypothetical protein